MRVYVRSKVDISKDVDLSKLSKLEALKVSIRFAFSKSSIAVKKRKKIENELLEEHMKRVDNLRKIILFKLSSVLDNNQEVVRVSVLINRNNDDILEEVLDSSDFISYDIKRVEDNSDYLISFPDMPIKIIFSRRRLD